MTRIEITGGPFLWRWTTRVFLWVALFRHAWQRGRMWPGRADIMALDRHLHRSILSGTINMKRTVHHDDKEGPAT